MRELLERFWAYLWRGHDGSAIGTGGQGARHLFLAGSVAFLGALAFVFPVKTGNEPEFLVSSVAAKAPHPLIGEYCMGCHDSVERTAGLAFDEMSLSNVGKNDEKWEAVLRRLNSGLMPPRGSPRPSAGEASELIRTISSRLDARGAPPAPTMLRRLTRSEYRYVIRDLLGLNVDVTTLLPPDPSSRGFDNIGEVLTSSPSLVEGYLKAGMKISRLAVGDIQAPSSRQVVTVPVDLNNREYVEGMPLGTRGGTRADMFFPVDAVYEIEVRAGPGRTLFQKFGPGKMPEVDFTISGRHIKLDADGKARVRVKAGEHPVTAALLDADIGPGVDDVFAQYNTKGAVLEVAVNGPFNPTGVGDTASRRKIFVCHPKSSAEERGCARTIINRLASRAFRRPVDINGAEMQQLMARYDEGRKGGKFETGVQTALSFILVDPRFIYRIEYEPAGTAPGETYDITPVELASRLSFFLWSSIPDDNLMSSAVSGKLARPDELDRQVRRMLADPRSMALVENFGGQWLHLQTLDIAERESDHFDGSLRSAMRTETEMLLADVMRGDRPLLDLLNANHTYLNERLAKHYGIDGVVGDYFREVVLPQDSLRRGLLGQGSVLTLTSVANRTSPVIRGAWILENILGVPPSPPPPGVSTEIDGGAAPTTMRERLAEHRKNPVCASCHNMMDPIGLSLENFDNVGRWRTLDAGQPIDASSVMVDGSNLNGVGDLRKMILRYPNSFVSSLTSKLMTYGLGRQVGPHEMPAVREVMRKTRNADYRFADVIKAIVSSRPFLTRTKPGRAPAMSPLETAQNDKQNKMKGKGV